MAQDHSSAAETMQMAADRKFGEPIMQFANPRRELLGLMQALVASLRAGATPQIVMVSGLEGGEGATTVAWNLAQAIAQEFSGRVCLVRMLDDEVSAPVEATKNVGAADVIGVFFSHRDLSTALDLGLRESLTRISPDPLIYLVDGPPLLGSLEAYRLCSEIDGLVLVAEAERTTGAALDAARAVIAGCRCAILGAVLNKRRRRLLGFLYGLLGSEFRPRAVPPVVAVDGAPDRLT